MKHFHGDKEYQACYGYSIFLIFHMTCRCYGSVSCQTIPQKYLLGQTEDDDDYERFTGTFCLLTTVLHLVPVKDRVFSSSWRLCLS